MFKRFLPKRDIFFPLFRELVQHNYHGAELLSKMVNHLDEAAAYAKEIAVVEKQADNIARHLFDELHKTFVTPFDRNDIQRLTGKLDDVLDQINRTARRLVLYQVKDVPRDVAHLSDFVVRITQSLQEAVQIIENLSRAEAILRYCITANELEEQADSLITTGISQLFSEEEDVKQFLKMKEIYESFQAIFSSARDAADAIKNIVLEYS